MMTIFYVDKNGNYYIDTNNNYYITREGLKNTKPIKHNSHIYNKQYSAYLYLNGAYKKMNVYIYQ